MSIQYEYLGETDLQSMSAEESEFYNFLPLCMAVTQIAFLCEESAEEFVRRAKLMGLINEVEKGALRKFYGLKINVNTSSSYEWAVNCMGKTGDFLFNEDDIQPDDVSERIFDIVYSYYEDDTEEEFRGKIREVVRDYNRGIREMPHKEDSCGLEWQKKIRATCLLYEENKEKREEDLTS